MKNVLRELREPTVKNIIRLVMQLTEEQAAELLPMVEAIFSKKIEEQERILTEAGA